MSFPTSTDVRELLEGYGIDSSVVSSSWIDNRISKFIVPFIERTIKRSVEGTEQVTEYLSGNGRSVLMLSRKNINSLVSISYVSGGDYDTTISLNSVVLIADQGMIRVVSNLSEGEYSSIFFKGIKNIKVVYNIGSSTIEEDLKEAITMLTAEVTLGQLANRTGGGSLNVQGFGRNYGDRGKYTNIRNDLSRWAKDILKSYKTGVIST